MTTVNMIGLSLSGQSGTGAFAGNVSPSFTTPVLGTPSSGTLTSCTGLPISTGISGLGTGVATALGLAVVGSGNVTLGNATTQWTPVATFVTPGDLSNSYNTQHGIYAVNGGILCATFTLIWTPTYTTASGNFLITGLPTAANGVVTINWVGTCWSNGITYPASCTSLVPRIVNNAQQLEIIGTGSGSVAVNVTTTQITSGVVHTLQGTITYCI